MIPLQTIRHSHVNESGERIHALPRQIAYRSNENEVWVWWSSQISLDSKLEMVHLCVEDTSTVTVA